MFVASVTLPRSKTASGNTSSLMSACLTAKGLLRKRNNLRYSSLASEVRPNRAKKTNAKKGLIHSSQYTVDADTLSADHMLFGIRAGSQSE